MTIRYKIFGKPGDIEEFLDKEKKLGNLAVRLHVKIDTDREGLNQIYGFDGVIWVISNDEKRRITIKPKEKIRYNSRKDKLSQPPTLGEALTNLERKLFPRVKGVTEIINENGFIYTQSSHTEGNGFFPNYRFPFKNCLD